MSKDALRAPQASFLALGNRPPSTQAEPGLDFCWGWGNICSASGRDRVLREQPLCLLQSDTSYHKSRGNATRSPRLFLPPSQSPPVTCSPPISSRWKKPSGSSEFLSHGTDLYLDSGRRYALIMPPAVSRLFVDALGYFIAFKNSTWRSFVLGGNRTITIISKAQIPECEVTFLKKTQIVPTTFTHYLLIPVMYNSAALF